MKSYPYLDFDLCCHGHPNIFVAIPVHFQTFGESLVKIGWKIPRYLIFFYFLAYIFTSGEGRQH